MCGRTDECATTYQNGRFLVLISLHCRRETGPGRQVDRTPEGRGAKGSNNSQGVIEIPTDHQTDGRPTDRQTSRRQTDGRTEEEEEEEEEEE